jgi:hypothetical protein
VACGENQQCLSLDIYMGPGSYSFQFGFRQVLVIGYIMLTRSGLGKGSRSRTSTG